MATVRVGGCLAVMLLAVSLAQGQGRQGQVRQGQIRPGQFRQNQAQAPEQQPEGRSLVDWYFFDVSNLDVPEGRLVSVPPVAHHRSFSHGAKTASIDRSDRLGRCFHRGTSSEGVCANMVDCAYAARQMQHWGHAEMCADGALVCCPGLAADAQYTQHAQDDFPSPSWDPYTFQYFPAPSCGHPHHQHDHHGGQQQQNFHPAPPMPQVPVSAPPQDFQYFDNLYQQAAPQPTPAPALPPVVHAPHVQPMAQPPMKPMARPPAKPMAQPPTKPMSRPPMKPMAQPPMKAPTPEPLVPLIDAATPAGKQPGDVARKKCVEYEKYAPTVRFGPDKDCIPNHTYPIGGNPALPREFPHFAQLGSGDRGDIQWFCGGALIAPSWIVTAAHCLYSGSRKVQWVRLGDLEPESDEDDSNPQIIAVAQAVRHPDYKVPEVYNDIALLRLAREPDMSTPHVRPACLQVDTKLKKDKLNLIGFGLTEENGDPAKALMEVALWRTPGDKCKDFFEGPINLRQLPDGLRDESQLCAGLDQVGKDACQGDSGGPLNTPYSPTCMHAIPGITSFGQGCGRGAPGVYTRVSHYVPWIERIVWPEEFE